MYKNNGIEIYNNLELGIIDLEEIGRGIEIHALLKDRKVGVVTLEEPKVSLFNQGGKNELNLSSILIDEEYEGEGIVSFLIYGVIKYSQLENRVITMYNDYFKNGYLLRRGFEVESITEEDVFVYGKNYHYNLENIDSAYFDLLDEDKLDKIDNKFIENKLNKIEEIEKEEYVAEILEELLENIIGELNNADEKLIETGEEPLFNVEELLEQLYEEDLEDLCDVEEIEVEIEIDLDFLSDNFFKNINHFCDNDEDLDVKNILNFEKIDFQKAISAFLDNYHNDCCGDCYCDKGFDDECYNEDYEDDDYYFDDDYDDECYYDEDDDYYDDYDDDYYDDYYDCYYGCCEDDSCDDYNDIIERLKQLEDEDKKIIIEFIFKLLNDSL